METKVKSASKVLLAVFVIGASAATYYYLGESANLVEIEPSECNKPQFSSNCIGLSTPNSKTDSDVSQASEHDQSESLIIVSEDLFAAAQKRLEAFEGSESLPDQDREFYLSPKIDSSFQRRLVIPKSPGQTSTVSSARTN